MTALPAKQYSTLLLDPPWMERGGGVSKRGADRHYPLVPTLQLPAVILQSGKWLPARPRTGAHGETVPGDEATGCSVWMWATANFLDDALWLMKQLGAQYITNVVWVKEGSDPTDAALHDGLSLGLGQRFRLCHEHLLYGRIGRVPVPAPVNRLPSVIIAPRTRHSEKPVQSYELIERHDSFAGLPGDGAAGAPGGNVRLEMFARRGRAGWDSWGNEAPILEAANG